MTMKIVIPEGRRGLGAVIRTAVDVIRIEDAQQALDVGRSDAAMLVDFAAYVAHEMMGDYPDYLTDGQVLP